MVISDDKLADLWMKNSDQLWRVVYANPLIAITVFIRWYAMIEKNNVFLAKALLVTGIAVMLIQWVIISRMAHYTAAMREAISSKLPDINKPLLGLSGTRMAKAVPLVIAALFALILIFGRPE